jgi:galactokinase
MTGAGFGGCAIALVEEKHAEAFMGNVSQIYSGQTGYRPEFYPAAISDGAGEEKDVSK